MYPENAVVYEESPLKYPSKEELKVARDIFKRLFFPHEDADASERRNEEEKEDLEGEEESPAKRSKSKALSGFLASAREEKVTKNKDRRPNNMLLMLKR